MNYELWDKIAAFDFDNPKSEYCFSLRLAAENYWTKSFTQEAILEYKKFMYLAATSDYMVSPSEVVDTVWHQHLIFTQSYQDFCVILGKQVQHIPSTHNKEEFGKFQLAKERTIKFYENEFGLQPKNIWGFGGMFESLNLEKARFKLRTVIIISILVFIGLTIPAYFLLRPLYQQINNPYFIVGLLILILCVFAGLWVYNKTVIKKIVEGFDASSFINKLQPFELVYLKTQKLHDVINGSLNELVEQGAVNVVAGHSLELVKNDAALTIEQLQITSALSESGTVSYQRLVRQLLSKPVFRNTANSMDAFRKFFNKSKKFGVLFYGNLAVLMLLLLFSFTRIVTGLTRDKPVIQIVLLTFVLIIAIVCFLIHLTKQVATSTIPDLYTNKVISPKQAENSWQWSYFLYGTATFSPVFLPIIRYPKNDYADRSSHLSSESGCGSSCGSSCSSCGGCGGD